jgi:hypothetical protein
MFYSSNLLSEKIVFLHPMNLDLHIKLRKDKEFEKDVAIYQIKI